MKFTDLKLKPHICKALEKIRLTEPTEVQAKAIPLLLTGNDVVVRSKTGSGKTFAFLLPILEMLTPEKKLQAMILAPTRELAEQISKELRKISREATFVTIYGGVSYGPQEDKLRDGAQIAIATPGRLIDHLERGNIDPSTVRFVVLDEADRMLDMGFINDMKRILSATPKTRQTLLFSATMPPEIVQLAEREMKNTEILLLQKDEITVKKIRQQCVGVDKKKKMDVLLSVLKDRAAEKVLVFVNTKDWAERLSGILRRKRFKAASIHSKLSQARRNRVIQEFNKGFFNILVATDIASRGLHIDNVTHVVNYDIPRNPKDYVHRIGRTGRAGKEGDAITLVTSDDSEFLHLVEQEIRMKFEVQISNDGRRPAYVAPVEAHFEPAAPQAVPSLYSGAGDDWGLD